MRTPKTINEQPFDEHEFPMCDFNKFTQALMQKDEEAAKQWYQDEFLKSGFANSSYEPFRRLKNGLIVLLGYMRSVAISQHNIANYLWMECGYIRIAEGCTDTESIYSIFIQAFRDFTDVTSLQGLQGSNMSECVKMNACVNYILGHQGERLTLASVAAACGYNPAYLGRKFKQVFNITFNNYVLTVRIKTAAAVLLYSDKSIAEIAEYYKFSSQSHFSNVFKRYYKMTPLQYRNANKLHK